MSQGNIYSFINLRLSLIFWVSLLSENHKNLKAIFSLTCQLLRSRRLGLFMASASLPAALKKTPLTAPSKEIK